MILSDRYCRCCEQDRWHELEVAGTSLPGWARVALWPVLALAAAWGGRWACGECDNLASDLAALARRAGAGAPLVTPRSGLPGSATGTAQSGAGRDSSVRPEPSYTR